MALPCGAMHLTEPSAFKGKLSSPAMPNWTKWLYDSYISHMSTHSVAQAKNQLSELIDRALKGEDVVITRHGQPVVELKPIPKPPRPVTKADLEWLKRHRVGRIMPKEDAGTLVSRMRDEDW
jgi:prevent-host-death family protein